MPAASPSRAPDGRVPAPLGRRRCEVLANRATGGYRIVSALDRERARAGGGAVLHARHATAGAAPGGRPYLPRAFSVAAAEPADGGVRLDFLLEAVGPGHRAARGARAGRRAAASPARSGRPFSMPGRGLAGGRRGDPRRRRDRDRAAGDPAPRARRARRRRSGSCSAFATAPTPAGVEELFRCEEVRLASEDGHAGHRGYVTDLLVGAARRRRRRLGGRLRLRAAGDARGGARAVRRARRRAPSWRWRRRWPAASAPASAAPSRSPRAATCASASTGRSSAPTRSRPRWSRDRAIERARPLARALPDCGSSIRSSTARGPSTRSPPGAPSATRSTPSFRSAPSSRRRSPPSRGPATRRRGSTRRRPGWSTRSGCRTRASTGFLADDLPQLATLPVPLIVSVMAPSARRRSRPWSSGSARASEVAAIELNVSCPNVKSGLIVGEQPAETLRAARAAATADRKPLIVKLTPNCADPAAVAARRRGGRRRRGLADQHPAGDRRSIPATLEPWLGAGSGGLSGPAMRPVALDQVRRVAAEVSIPVIGMGGIESGADALAFLAARRDRGRGRDRELSRPAGGDAGPARARRTSSPRRGLESAPGARAWRSPQVEVELNFARKRAGSPLRAACCRDILAAADGPLRRDPRRRSREDPTNSG